MISKLDEEVIRSYYRLSITVSSIIAFLIAATFYTVLNFQIEYAFGLTCLSLSIALGQTKRVKYNHIPLALTLLGGLSCFLTGPAGWLIGGTIIGLGTYNEFGGKHMNWKEFLEKLTDTDYFDLYRVLVLSQILTNYGYTMESRDISKFYTEKYISAKFSPNNGKEQLLLRNQKIHTLEISWDGKDLKRPTKFLINDKEENIKNTDLSEIPDIIEDSIERFKRDFKKIMSIGDLRETILKNKNTLIQAIENPEKILQDKAKMNELNKIHKKILEMLMEKPCT